MWTKKWWYEYNSWLRPINLVPFYFLTYIPRIPLERRVHNRIPEMPTNEVFRIGISEMPNIHSIWQRIFDGPAPLGWFRGWPAWSRPGRPVCQNREALGEIRLSELRSVLTDGKISSRSLRPSQDPPREITFDHANRTGNVDIGKSTKSDSWKWTHSENRTSPEGSKGARSWIATRIRARARFENYVHADAARSG